MNGALLKKIAKAQFTILIITVVSLFLTMGPVTAKELKTIKLPAPNKDRNGALMAALSNKASAESMSKKELSKQDLSDLLWAAAGINRPDIKKRTFSSAMNTQDTEVYVLMKAGIYVYDYEKHALNPVASGDHRADISGSMKMGGGGAAPGVAGRGPAPGSGQTGNPPGEAVSPGEHGKAPGGSAPAGAGGRKRLTTFAIDLVLVSEPSKYKAGSDDLKAEWGAFSAGMIAQNVELFCSANNMGTRPRAAFDKETVKSLLKLKENQNPVIEMPVGYLD